METIRRGRIEIEDILSGKDSRLIAVVGPCSIHDVTAAKEYAERLKRLATTVADDILLVMRVYFSKPRTTVGWKGLINDPYLNDSFKIEEGFRIARKLLVDLAELGIPVGTEALDPITPQYLDDLICWYAIGARTAESQTHREMASGLSGPVGIKNGTDGSVDVAINALHTMGSEHAFLGINQEGQCSVIQTRGNKFGHVILRGGKRPNYDSVSVQLAIKELEKDNLSPNIMIDCSHGNSLKNHELQPMVFDACLTQRLAGNTSIIGLMLESNINAGKQKISNPSNLEYGVSVTDACIDWKDTEKLITESADKLRRDRSKSGAW
ncbi:UNVERIFIED_CONTAM: hypothetical protein GTU68_066623 [Idotea baltica]|nr:hypothetical protein [Idotea baltica]